jgi:hypothetical protein
MIVVYYWAGTIPHLSLSVTGKRSAYISYYPPNENSAVGHIRQYSRLHEYTEDLKHRKGLHAKECIIPSQEDGGFGLSEQAIINWFETTFPEQERESGYHVINHNCASVVLHALRAGAMFGGEKSKEIKEIFAAYSRTLLDLPGDVFDFVDRIAKETYAIITAFIKQLNEFPRTLQEFYDTHEYIAHKEQLVASIRATKFCKSLGNEHLINSTRKFEIFVKELRSLTTQEEFLSLVDNTKQPILDAIEKYKIECKKNDMNCQLSTILKAYSYLHKIMDMAKKMGMEIAWDGIHNQQFTFIKSIKETSFWKNLPETNQAPTINSVWSHIITQLVSYITNTDDNAKYQEQKMLYDEIMTHMNTVFPLINTLITDLLFSLSEKQQERERLINNPMWVKELLSEVKADINYRFFTYSLHSPPTIFNTRLVEPIINDSSTSSPITALFTVLHNFK